MLLLYMNSHADHTPTPIASEPRPAAQEKQQPREIVDFTYQVAQNVKDAWDVVAISYKGSDELHKCQVTVQVWYEDKQSFNFDRLWAVWALAETKIVYFTSRVAHIEYVQIRGTAEVNGQQVRIDKTWEVRRPPRVEPGITR